MKRHIWRRVGRIWGFRLKSPYVNSLFLRLMLLTAIITFASVFLASLLPFAYLSTELRADIENYNNQRLLHVKNTADSTVFAPVMSAFSDIVLTDQVSQAPGFASAAGEVKPSGLYAVHGLLQKKTAQYPLADIALYNPGGRVLLSATYGVTYLTGTAVGLTGDVSWLGEISRISAGTRAAVWLEPRAFPDGSRQSGEASLLSLIAPLNSGERSGLYACLSLSDTVLRQAMDTAGRSADAAYFMVSPEGNAIAGQPEEEILEGLRERSGELFTTLGDTPQSFSLGGIMVTVVRSDYNQWLYVMCLPESTYYQKSSLFQRNVLLACLAVFGGMLLVCAAFAIKISYPFGKLAESIRPAGFGQRTRAQDVFGGLEEAFTELLEEKDVQAQLIHGNRELVSRSFFSHLLQGKPMPAADREAYLQFLRPYYPGLLFTVCCIRPEGGASLPDAGRILEERRPEGTVLTCLECDGGGVMAVICSADDPEKLACWFEELLRGPLLEKCCGAMGDPCAEMGDIGIPYRQALSALQYGAYFPDKSFYRYEETSSWDQNTNIDRRRMDDFLEQLAVCNSADAAACLEELRRLICETPLSWQSCTQIVGEALLALEKVAENNHVDLSELFTVSLPDQLGQLFYLDEMFRALEDAAEAILRHIQRESAPASAQYAEQAAGFIEEHYQNDISIQDIADELGISRYHLCRVFKESRGETLLEYIAEVRMERAKRLLEETELSIGEVAQQVGFNNVTYFHKRFKQSFGITPSQLRRG